VIVAFDTETCLFGPGRMAPPLVCVTWQSPGEEPHILHANDLRAEATVRAWLESPCTLVGHHVVYDLAVVAARWPHLVISIFAKYDRGEIFCTKIRQQLLDIAGGEFRGYLRHFERDGLSGVRWIPREYTLEALTFRAAGRRLDKDTWRLRYGELLDTPLSRWPEGALTYPLEDARATLDVYLAQEEHVAYLPDQAAQCRAAWALHLTSAWGLRTDVEGVDALERDTREALALVEGDLRAAGLVRADGSRDTKAAAARVVAACAAAGVALRLTDGGAPSLDADACKASGDPLLEDYAELTSLKAVLAKDLPVLRAGTTLPVHTSFGMAASGRTTSSKPNVQNPRRLPGIREAFVPREGYVFAQGDFSSLELHTLAQVCVTLFGQSELAGALNAGRDPHTAFACDILGISYEEGVARHTSGDEEFDNARQTAKVANFGFPGGLGAEKLCLFARKTYNVRLTEDSARKLKAAWLERWPEMRRFFSHVNSLLGDDGLATIQQIGSGRWRGGCHYNAACNTFFQGLGADAAKRALWLVSESCYADEESPLYGAKIVNFVHDEIILETPDAPEAHDVAIALGNAMVRGANEYLPDVPARVAPLLAKCWSKKSKPIYENGRLVPWAPKSK
jgi:hypothetical protein